MTEFAAAIGVIGLIGNMRRKLRITAPALNPGAAGRKTIGAIPGKACSPPLRLGGKIHAQFVRLH
jgi:hypothetical protein